MRSDGRYTMNPELEDQPISRTYQYRKVMKPMLERKRRARINRCLDELKELMVAALQAEGENVSKLEKADILELTVNHLQKLRKQHTMNVSRDTSYAERFRAGFTQCAAEVSTYLATLPIAAAVDPTSTSKLLQHLGTCIRKLESSNVHFEKNASFSSQSSCGSQQNSYNIIQKLQHSTLIQNHDDVENSVWRPW
ncbi:Enhancer of split mgamma protein, putative [Pediculus humanus corporis]|uniref:Enhancer of split mgamma protein, putative n=1 Tax=Pediculus humanus subsp. corporis TaxID=121224 RepID=E0VQC0_PEDHC|nr:Enhancer of split mgamma protein, putative [Pediculus humanus corporis]EEB15576.1 Enhancer of split mgamma protein, putative [Pediculus humanus corporis]